MRELRRLVQIPVFTLSETCELDDKCGVKRYIHQWKGRDAFAYHHRPLIEETTGTGFNYNLFPVVLDRHGAPWDLATNFLLSKLEAESRPNMTSWVRIAHDLGAFKEWLDQQSDPEALLLRFPQHKQARVTYRYNAYLEGLKKAGVSGNTLKRRMGTVISFYRWMEEERLFEPEYPPWQEKTFLLSYENKHGRTVRKPVATTDLAIKAPKSEDALDDTVQDGGKLRPLTDEEQQWFREALRERGNPEMKLLLLFMLCTGARIQTACTLRVRHFTNPNPRFSKAQAGRYEVYKLKVGPEGGIDTKNDKNMILQVPRALYETFSTYSQSDRAKRRRERAKGGDHPGQYLFLTQQGSPYYLAKEEATAFDPDLARRHQKVGGTVRQFLKDHLIPYVQKHHDPIFKMQIHDLRATFGMNMEGVLMRKVEAGEISLEKARIILMGLMGHESSATTDLYLGYRNKMKMIRAAIDEFGEFVETLITDAMSGTGYNDE